MEAGVRNSLALALSATSRILRRDKPHEAVDYFLECLKGAGLSLRPIEKTEAEKTAEALVDAAITLLMGRRRPNIPWPYIARFGDDHDEEDADLYMFIDAGILFVIDQFYALAPKALAFIDSRGLHRKRFPAAVGEISDGVGSYAKGLIEALEAVNREGCDRSRPDTSAP